MPNLRAIRRRITSVQNIQQVTNAMRMVAAARMRRAQERMFAARPYSGKIDTLLRHLISRVETSKHPLLVERPPERPERICLVVVTADRGLCGSFNSNLIRRAATQIEEYGAAKVSLICVGRKGRDYFTRRDYEIIGEHVNIFNNLEFSHAEAVVEEVIPLYSESQYDRIDIVYNEFKSVIQQNIVAQQYLPIVPEEPVGDELFTDYLYEPSKDEILESLLPLHLNVQMWQVLLESNAAEQAARMTAMESATKNAGELIDELTLSRNKVRQTSITMELADIVGGAEALS